MGPKGGGNLCAQVTNSRADFKLAALYLSRMLLGWVRMSLKIGRLSRAIKLFHLQVIEFCRSEIGDFQFQFFREFFSIFHSSIKTRF